jgi:hypothetical protein
VNRKPEQGPTRDRGAGGHTWCEDDPAGARIAHVRLRIVGHDSRREHRVRRRLCRRSSLVTSVQRPNGAATRGHEQNTDETDVADSRSEEGSARAEWCTHTPSRQEKPDGQSDNAPYGAWIHHSSSHHSGTGCRQCCTSRHTRGSSPLGVAAEGQPILASLVLWGRSWRLDCWVLVPPTIGKEPPRRPDYRCPDVLTHPPRVSRKLEYSVWDRADQRHESRLPLAQPELRVGSRLDAQ